MQLRWPLYPATPFCWGLSCMRLVRLALASRCSPWPSTQSSGAEALRPPSFSSGAPRLLHSSESFLRLSSLLLPRERTDTDHMLLCRSSAPLPCSPFCLSVPPGLSYPQAGWTPGARLLPFCIKFAWRALSLCVPAVAGNCGSRAPGIAADRSSPVLPPTSRIPAALNKAAPSGVLRAGFYFVLFCF